MYHALQLCIRAKEVWNPLIPGSVRAHFLLLTTFGRIGMVEFFMAGWWDRWRLIIEPLIK